MLLLAQAVDQVDLIFSDGLGSPPINNVFVIGNQSVSPNVEDGFIEILQESIFIRGDANNDLILDVSDPIYTVFFLSGTITDPPCELAMDANVGHFLEPASNLEVGRLGINAESRGRKAGFKGDPEA